MLIDRNQPCWSVSGFFFLFEKKREIRGGRRITMGIPHRSGRQCEISHYGDRSKAAGRLGSCETEYKSVCGQTNDWSFGAFFIFLIKIFISFMCKR